MTNIEALKAAIAQLQNNPENKEIVFALRRLQDWLAINGSKRKGNAS